MESPESVAPVGPLLVVSKPLGRASEATRFIGAGVEESRNPAEISICGVPPSEVGVLTR